MSWKYKCLPAEKIATGSTVNKCFFFASIELYRNSNFCLVLTRSSVKQKSAIYISPNRTIFIAYELVTWSRDLNDDFI